MTLLTLVIIIGIIALIGGIAWAFAPTFIKVLEKNKANRDAERAQKATIFREIQERQEKNRIAADKELCEKWAKEQAEKHERLSRNPIDYILSFLYRHLAQTEQVNSETEAAEDNYKDAKRNYDEFSKEYSEDKVPTTRDFILQHIATVGWIVLAVVQAGLTGWILYALTNDIFISVLGTAGFVVFLEGPGIIISQLCNLKKKELITETKQRLGIVVSCAVMVAVIATLSVMAGYRAYLVNEDALISAHASQIVAAEDNDSYLLSVANEIEIQTKDKIEHEGLFFGVLEAGIALAETILALFIPACLMTREFRRRKLSLDIADQNQKAAKQRLKNYQVQKLTELARIMEANQIDLTILESFKEDGQLMLSPDEVEALPPKDYSTFFYGSKKREACLRA